MRIISHNLILANCLLIKHISFISSDIIISYKFNFIA